MDAGTIVPLAVFAFVVLIVAIGWVSKTRDAEVRAHHALREAEMEHQRQMQRLELELNRVRHGG